jgi:hypothetical protein
MGKKHKSEEIVAKLRQVDVLTSPHPNRNLLFLRLSRELQGIPFTAARFCRSCRLRLGHVLREYGDDAYPSPVSRYHHASLMWNSPFSTVTTNSRGV